MTLQRRILVSLVLGIPLMFGGNASGGPREELVKRATVKEKESTHVVFREIIKSSRQNDWTAPVYAAEVEVFQGGNSVFKGKGSTLPNPVSISKGAAWRYSVVSATCSYPGDLRGRFLAWSYEVGKTSAGNSRPQLRLAALEVPAVEVSSQREAEGQSEFLKLCFDPTKASEREKAALMFANGVLIHEGFSGTNRGSAACLTIAREDAARFFSVFRAGDVGTLEIDRGFEDEKSHQSYCY